MARTRSKNLKLFSERPPAPPAPQVETLGCLPEVLSAFQRATGWSLHYVAGPESSLSNSSWSAPVNPGDGIPPGQLRLEPLGSEPAWADVPSAAKRDVAPAAKPLADGETARALASAIAAMLQEWLRTRHALWRREAELAAGVPLVPHPEEEKHLAARLEAVLRGGAEAIGCHAAALYLLDEATTELKLRSCWALPFDRLIASARPLQGAMADLEALLGHAVVIEDAKAMRYWKVPEDFPAAVCVPVSTPTTLLGTLWVFCDENRPFDDHQTNILEVVAGRLAAELEREMLLREGVDGAQLKRQLSAAERLQRNQLPTVSPLLDGWDVSGWTAQAQAVGGDFHDWFCLPNGLLAVAAGHAMDCGIPAALSASALKTAVRAHSHYHRQAEQVIKQVNLALWTSSAGDQRASLFYGLVEIATGRICCSFAGQPVAFLLRADGWQSLSHTSSPLGESPEADFPQFGYELKPGEALVVLTAGFRDAPDGQGRPLGEADVAECLLGRLALTADQLAAVARDRLNIHAAASESSDRTILVVKRTA